MSDVSSSVSVRLPVVGLPARLGLVGDERLALLAGGGSERAFAAVYDRYHRPLYRYCRSILRNDADAQDALQSTLAAAFAALRAGKRNAPLRPWLFRIAHNESISIVRRRRSAEGEEDAAGSAVLLAVSAEERVFERDRFARLMVDLRELPEEQRAALLMRELSGLSYDEIAVALETSPVAARQKICAARRALLELEEGRAMVCEEVQDTISLRDGRLLRGRRVRAHLRGCESCTAYAAAIDARRSDLRAFTPVLPAAAVASLRSSLFGGSAGHGAAAAGPGVAGAGGKALASVGVSKLIAGAAIVAGLAGTAAATTSLLHHDSAPVVRRPRVSAGWVQNRRAASGVRAGQAQPAPALAGTSTASTSGNQRSSVATRRHRAGTAARPCMQPCQPASVRRRRDPRAESWDRSGPSPRPCIRA
jgi:RNA polymerase sigma factor (sigma-70 family)